MTENHFYFTLNNHVHSHFFYLAKRPFLATSEQSNRETENRDHFFSLLSSVNPPFMLRIERRR
jgi:hypothetical protein